MSRWIGTGVFIVAVALLVQRCVPDTGFWGSPARDASPECRIKGNISLDGERIYHVPGGEWYDKTRIDTSKGERWFCSEAEAREAGWRRAYE